MAVALLACAVSLPGAHALAGQTAAPAGVLTIVSDPTGSDVYVDGQLVGQSPVTLPSVVAGDHRVRVVKDGWLENSRVVKTTERKPTSVRIRLTARPRPTAAPGQSTGLRIVVIEGEDAINVIQQKTAVAPVVEVRDRNDQPVGGAVVRFAIQGGRASFNGARTLTLTTNAAGRAVVSGLTPTGSGAFQISASAAFQGQTAAATIAQTNVLTAAQAASAAGASSAGGAGAGAGGSAAGGGAGGLSATTIGIVGGAVAGGTIAVKEAVGAAEFARYQGTFSIDTVETITNRRNNVIVGNCFWRIVIAGTMTADVGGSDAAIEGEVDTNWTETEVSRTCSSPQPLYSDSWLGMDMSGSAASLQFSRSFTGSNSGTNGFTVTRTLTFSGALSGDAITGTVSMSFLAVGLAQNGDDVIQTYPSSSASVTLRKQ